MLFNSKARILELNSKLAEILTSKGITATSDETTTSLINKVSEISGGDDSLLKGLIQRDITEFEIPDGVTVIGETIFQNNRAMKKIKIPETVEVIQITAFKNCILLEDVLIPKSVKTIKSQAFDNCYSLTELILPEGILTLEFASFRACYNVKKLFLPKTLNNINNTTFHNCGGLIDVTLADGFHANNLNLSASTLYSRETIVSWLNALADRTGQTTYTLTIGAENLAKLTEEDIAIATVKNWTLS